jgi:hypothetical protein
MFSFCSHEVKPHPSTGTIFSGKPAGGIVEATGCLWMSGKRTRAEGEAVATIRR